MSQNYKNHIRWHAPTHFFLYPATLIGTIASAVCIFTHPDRQCEWIFITILFALLTTLSFLVRQHYALNNQNRIVRLEMRFRYFAPTGKRLEPLETQLSFGQIAALRFAPDEELPDLMQRTLSEQLSPDAIKKSIKNWLPDEMRA